MEIMDIFGSQHRNLNSSATATTAKVIAMQNELVLKLIAKKINTAADLRTLRRTCTLWNRLFAQAIYQSQDQEFLELIAATDLVDAGGQRIQNLTFRFEKSMWCWTNLMLGRNLTSRVGQDPVVTKYRLFNLHSADPIDVDDFFGVYGPTNTHLDLVFNGLWQKTTGALNPVNVDWIREIVFELLPNLVDLRIRVKPDSSTPDPISDLGISGVNLSHQDRKIPKLRRLEFHVQEISHLRRAYASLLTDLLRAATGLTSISVGAFGNTSGVLSALAGSNHPDEPLQPPLCLPALTTLEIHNLTETELKLLHRLATEPGAEQSLRLQQLTTSIKYTNNDPTLLHLFHRFLESQSTSLTHFDLELQYGLYPPTTKIDLPTLAKVRSFRFKCQGMNVGIKSLPMQILTRPLEVVLPGLVRLEYVNRPKASEDGQVEIPDDLEGLGHPRVTNLRLNANFISQNAGGSVCVGEGLRLKFGALTNLQLNLKTRQSTAKKALPHICGSLPSLEILHLVYNDFGVSSGNGEEQSDAGEPVLDLDSLLSGVPTHKLGSLKRFLDFSGPMGRIKVDSLQAFVRDNQTEEHGLQDLRVLKKFVLEFYGARFRLTNIGGYFGLALASSTVQHISIEAFDLERAEPSSGAGGGNGSTTGLRIQKRNTRGPDGDIAITEPCERFLRSILGQTAVIRF